MEKLDRVKTELKKLDPPGNYVWLARKIGISPSLLSRHNSGGTELLYEHKVRIANLFKGVKIEDLFD